MPDYDWVPLNDEELLKLRICDLKLKLEGSWLEDQVAQLYRELEAKSVRIRPRAYLGDEWFSPEGMVAIAIPFFLAHPRLMSLERNIMLEVEGDEADYCMKLLRHEAGHCLDHAYRFSRKKRWSHVFGSPNQKYAPELYRPRPYSKSYVHNLDHWYAQSHPDEDFAETFAVWLDPESNWEEEYRDWPTALEKLKYLDKIVHSVKDVPPGGVKGYLPFAASRLSRTLEKYYLARRKANAEEYPDFYDSDLRRIFSGDASLSKREFGAGSFMRRHRKMIVESVSHWTGEKKYTVNQLVRRLGARCEELSLKLGKPESETHVEVAAYLATLVTHYLFTGQFKRSV